MRQLVVSSYLPGEGHYESNRFEVVPVLCDEDRGYWRGLAPLFDDPEVILVNIEHDLAVNDDQIAELFDCEHSLCAYAYAMHWVSTGNGEDVFAHCNNEKFVSEGDEFADWSAIGFIKVLPQARIAPLAEAHWHQVEVSIDKAVKGPWHMHWPAVDHWHW